MDNNINVCTLLSGALWAAGVAGFLAISLGLVDLRHGGLALVCFTTGSLIYLRRLIRGLRRREDAAFELGRLAGGGGSPNLHRVL